MRHFLGSVGVRGFRARGPFFTRHRYFDAIYSTYLLVYNMDECKICGKAEFDVSFLRLRWKLEDFD